MRRSRPGSTRVAPGSPATSSSRAGGRATASQASRPRSCAARPWPTGSARRADGPWSSPGRTAPPSCWAAARAGSRSGSTGPPASPRGAARARRPRPGSPGSAARGLAPFDPSSFPAEWSHPADDPRALPDDTPSEDARCSRTSPHPVRGATLAETLERLLRTPFADALTLDLARLAVEEERLGGGKATDLLAVSLSATDSLGHAYGPDSQEALAALEALDGHLGVFLSFLEARLGRGRLLVALTADHGVTPLPEVAEQLGLSQCRVPGGRVNGAGVAARIAALAREACGLAVAPEVTTDGDSAFALPAEAWKACRRKRGEVAQEVASRLAAVPGVVKAWTAPDLAAARCAGSCALYRASFDPERSGDWVVQLDPYCLWSSGSTGASHGSPYLPDRAVPLVFWGNGIAASLVRGPAHTVDVAPTLAARAGLPPGAPVDGRVLPLR